MGQGVRSTQRNRLLLRLAGFAALEARHLKARKRAQLSNSLYSYGLSGEGDQVGAVVLKIRCPARGVGVRFPLQALDLQQNPQSPFGECITENVIQNEVHL